MIIRDAIYDELKDSVDLSDEALLVLSNKIAKRVVNEYTNLEKFDLGFTDLERFKELFDKIGIGYGKDEDHVNGIVISRENVYQSYYNDVIIVFDKDGKFKQFEGYGD